MRGDGSEWPDARHERKESKLSPRDLAMLQSEQVFAFHAMCFHAQQFVDSACQVTRNTKSLYLQVRKAL